MKRFIIGSLLISILGLLNACQTTDLSSAPTIEPSIKAPVRAILVNPLDYVGEQRF